MHPWARPAAIAGVCAYQQSNDAFWKLHDFFFAKQNEITQANINDKIKEAAQQTGLNMDKLHACMEKPESSQKVDADAKEGESVGVRSTPTFFVNGHRILGAQDVQVFKDTIEQALKE